MLDLVKKFNILLDRQEKRKLGLLLLIETAGAFFEMLGVSIVVPLVNAIIKPEAENRHFIVICILAMIAIFIIKDLFLIFRNYYSSRLVYTSRFAMQQKMLKAFLKKPYSYFLNAKSGEVLRTIRSDVQSTYSLLNTLLSLIAESIVSIAIIAVVIYINPLMTLLIIAFITIIMLVIIKLIKPVLNEEGKIYRKNVAKAYGWLIQSIQGIKAIKIGAREAFFENNFEEAGKAEIESEKRFTILNSIPRIVIEMGCILAALITMLIMVTTGYSLDTLIPYFAAFAMAAVKLMPAFSRIVNSASAVSFYGPSIDRLIENIADIKEEEENSSTGQSITINDKVELKDITYRYNENSEAILENASMLIPAGHTVGIIGSSGAGKTTAVDVLLGLISPEKGEILSDGINVMDNYSDWLKHIGYIPQSIFMLDGTVRENIVFGNENSSDEKIWQVLEDAQLADFIRQQPEGLDTEIGERGIRLSGGQQQRLGIARAMYSDPDLLVFDEATSSLDMKTENAILESINALHGKKTIIIIAHRLETIENCDIVYRVEDKKIVKEH